MSFTGAIQEFFASQSGSAVQAVIALALLDFVTGTLRAIANGTFQAEALAAWVRKHLAGRVGPIFALLFIGYWADPALPKVPIPGADDVSINIVLAGGLAAAAAYTAETIASLKENFFPKQLEVEGPDGGPQTMDLDVAPSD